MIFSRKKIGRHSASFDDDSRSVRGRHSQEFVEQTAQNAIDQSANSQNEYQAYDQVEYAQVDCDFSIEEVQFPGSTTAHVGEGGYSGYTNFNPASQASGAADANYNQAVGYLPTVGGSQFPNETAAYSRHVNADQYRNALKQQQKQRKKRIGLAIVASFLVLVLAGIGVAFAYISSIDRNLQDGLGEELMSTLTASDSPSDPFYMLLIGIDKSEEREGSNAFGGAYRTDSMILTRVDPQNKKITMVSIYRDTRVNLPGHGQQKINAAYAFGGPALAVKTVSELAQVPIHHYAEIDFNGFEDIVNALGGIEVNVPMDINDPLAGEPLKAGPQTLNGAQALVLSRSRHAYDKYGDGDMMRAANQRMIISAILKKIMASDVATMTNSVNTFANYITTDFSVASILGFANTFRGIDVEKDIYSAMEPTIPLYENDIWWAILDEKPWREMMNRVDSGLPPTEKGVVDPNTGVTLSVVGDGGVSSSASSSSSSGSSSSTSLSGVKVAVRNGSGIEGCAAAAASKLSKIGAITDTGNADDTNYKKTLIIYNDDSDKEKAQKIADTLGVGTLKKNTGGTYAFQTDYLVVVGSDWK